MYQAIPENQPEEDGIVPEAAAAVTTTEEEQPLLIRKTSRNRQKETAASMKTTSTDVSTTTTTTTINDKILWCLWRTTLAVLWACCWIFGGYIVLFYLRAAWQQCVTAWNEGLAGLYRADLPPANHAMLVHFIGGAYIVIMAPLQFVPGLRNKSTCTLTFHRWNGRILLVGCGMAAMGGMYYVATAGSTAVPLVGQVANITNAIFGLLVLMCAIQIYRHAAMTKRIDLHKLWAYRLAGLICGSIAFRLYAIVAVLVVGVDSPHLKAAFLLAYYTYMVPFVVLADYLWHREEQQVEPSSQHASVYAVVGVTLGLLAVISTLILQSAVIWIPMMMVDMQSLEDEEDVPPFYGNE